MVIIDGTKITMTRGDTLRTKVVILRKDNGEEYTPESGDVIEFALKSQGMKVGNTDFRDKEPLLLKKIPNGTLQLELDPEDTKKLSFGEYCYEISITFSNGDVDTFIADAEFVLAREVH